MDQVAARINHSRSSITPEEIREQQAVERFALYLTRIGFDVLTSQFSRSHTIEGDKRKSVKFYGLTFKKPFTDQTISVVKQPSGTIAFELGTRQRGGDDVLKYYRKATVLEIQPGDDLYNEDGIKKILAEITFRVVTNPMNMAQIFNSGDKPALELIRPQYDPFGLVERLPATIKEITGLDLPVLDKKRPGLIGRAVGFVAQRINRNTAKIEGAQAPALPVPAIKPRGQLIADFKVAVDEIEFQDPALRQLADKVIKTAETSAEVCDQPRQNGNLLVSATARSSLIRTFTEMGLITPLLAHLPAEGQTEAFTSLSRKFELALQELATARVKAATTELGIILGLRPEATK